MLTSQTYSQVAFEFLFIIGLLSLLFLAFIEGYYRVSTQTNFEQDDRYVTELGRALQNEFYTAATVEKGYTRELYLPEKLGNKNYSIQIFPSDQLKVATLKITTNTLSREFRIPHIVESTSIIYSGQKITIEKVSETNIDLTY